MTIQVAQLQELSREQLEVPVRLLVAAVVHEAVGFYLGWKEGQRPGDDAY